MKFVTVCSMQARTKVCDVSDLKQQTSTQWTAHIRPWASNVTVGEIIFISLHTERFNRQTASAEVLTSLPIVLVCILISVFSSNWAVLVARTCTTDSTIPHLVLSSWSTGSGPAARGRLQWVRPTSINLLTFRYTTGDRSFSYLLTLGFKTDYTTSAPSLTVFRRKLKIHLNILCWQSHPRTSVFCRLCYRHRGPGSFFLLRTL